MAEICFECWCKNNEKRYSKIKYKVSKEPDMCEECGEYKPVIICKRSNYYLNLLKSTLKHACRKEKN